MSTPRATYLAAAVASALALFAVAPSFAQTAPQFQCQGANNEPVGSLEGNILVLDGVTGNVQLAGPGGCNVQGSGGGTGQPYIDVGTVNVTVSGSSVNFAAAPIDAVNLPAPIVAPGVQLQYELIPTGSGQTFSAILPFQFPSLPARSITGVAAGTYNAVLTGPAGVDMLGSALGQVVITGAGPITNCLTCPSNWTINTSQTWEQAFGRRFAQGTVGNVHLALNTSFNNNSPSGTANEIRSYAFTITNDDPFYGRLRALLSEGSGGTQWFWVSKGSTFQPAPPSAGPGDVMMLGYNLNPDQNGTWDRRCAGYGTTGMSWVVEGETGIPGTNPTPYAQRCKLERNKPYVLNVGFYHVQQLVTNKAHYNTCARPTNNPQAWQCWAYFAGVSLENEDPVEQ